MRGSQPIEIMLADPRTPAIAALVSELDEYMIALYPAESNHLVDIETLAASDVRFFAARAGDEPMGCGAIMLKSDYAEVKRIYVSPRARGMGLARMLLERLEAEARGNGLALMRLETFRIAEVPNLFGHPHATAHDGNLWVCGEEFTDS